MMQNSQMSPSQQRLLSSSFLRKLLVLPIVAVVLALCFNNVQAFLPHQNPSTAFRHSNHYVSSSTTILSSPFVAPSFLPRGQQMLPQFFVPSTNEHIIHRRCSITQLFSTMKRIPAELEDVPIPFIDPNNSDSSSSSSSLKFIECYADCTCEINGIEYTVAVPCDYSVSLCYASDEDPDELIPIDITDTALMDDIFPIAESIVAEEYGEDLVLQRTPETLTLVGELELDDDDDEEDDEDLDEMDNEDDDDEDEMDDDEEEVDVLLAFEHRDKEYQLVRIKDPILLVGKKNPQTADDATAMETRVLLTKEESDAIMPTLEEMYLNYQKELDENDEEFEDDEDENEGVTLATNVENDTANENEYDEDDVKDDIVTFYDPQADKTNTLKTIDCFIDRVYVVDNVEYTIATPCDYVATICTTDEEDEEELNPIDIEPDTTKVIDELFPLFADAVKDEFDGEMTLVRTPQYLTLVGDIDLDEELSDEDEEEDDDEEYDDDEEEEEEVQVILSFTKDGKEYSLVRELEPMLLVGKKPEKESDDITMDMRILLDAKESDEIVPILMEMYNDDDEDEDEE